MVPFYYSSRGAATIDFLEKDLVDSFEQVLTEQAMESRWEF